MATYKILQVIGICFYHEDEIWPILISDKL